jgi:uncharacterized protein YcbK (DUF882 family)
MKAKRGARVAGLGPQIWYVAGVYDMLHYQITQNEAVITSGTEGRHMFHSRHYAGLAADFRTEDLKPNEIQQILEPMKNLLAPQGFQLILESDHLHIEYDPTDPSRVWLPEVP